MKKTLNTTAVENELAGGASLFFKQRPQLPTENQSKPVPPNPVPYGVPALSSLPPKRVMKQRQPFDVYQDQYEELKHIADDERERGLAGSMSRMVREAIDEYLAVRKR